MAASAEAKLGPLVRLEGISIASLPPGAKGVKPSNADSPAGDNPSRPESSIPSMTLDTFIKNALTESIPFIDGVAPKDGSKPTWKLKGSPKKFDSSEASVQLYEYTVSGKDLDKVEGMSNYSADRKDETWFCRRSCHKNEAAKGTATWEEFKHSFKEHHAETEDAFTPTVIGARQAMTWDTSGLEIEIAGARWNHITMVVEEMKHKIDPKPLKNRTFPVVQIAASLEGIDEFLVISIPLNDFKKSPYAEYALDKSLVVASYVSVERVRILPDTGDIEWIMATASDAGGVLPQWMQNLAVPSAVAKDVEIVIAKLSLGADHPGVPARKEKNSLVIVTDDLPSIILQSFPGG
ncbi:hypothetical protein ACMFMG_006986 [Clarireedia jacksonii]